LFFFSSRRRHTIFSRDWSSDVCSSDLFPARAGGDAVVRQSGSLVVDEAADDAHPAAIRRVVHRIMRAWSSRKHGIVPLPARGRRSEERRVGKEGQAGWGPTCWEKLRTE